MLNLITVGSGKSSLLKALEKFETTVKVLPEPVSKWKDVRGINLLERMYTDPKNNLFPFQVWVHYTNVERALDTTAPRPRVFERLQGARVFTQVARDNGHLNETQHSILYELWKFAEKEHEMLPNLYVYVRASPQTCLRRIRDRNRLEEKSVTLEYLSSLHQYHQSWLNHGSIANYRGEQIPVLIVDADKDISDHPRIYEEAAILIMQSIYENEKIVDRENQTCAECEEPSCCGLLCSLNK